MTERDIGYAIDIVLACSDIDLFLQGRTFSDFQTDAMFQAAVPRKLEIIGEVAKRFSSEFKLKHSRIQWKNWAGL
jgi:uncharacterized protein with HEPN domain